MPNNMNNYQTTLRSWETVRESVRTLQGEHQKSINAKHELAYDIGERRARMEDTINEMRETNEKEWTAEIAEANDDIDRIAEDYNKGVHKLKSLHTHLQEALYAEMQHDKGCMAAGLSKDDDEEKKALEEKTDEA